MIATFSPPIRGTSKIDSLPRLFIGLCVQDGRLAVVAVDGDGEFETILASQANAELRYHNGEWVDIDGNAVEEALDG